MFWCTCCHRQFSGACMQAKVFNLLRGHDEAARGCRHLKLLNLPICNRGFCALLGLGSGRFKTLSRAERAGDAVAPLDGRYRPRGPPPQGHKRGLVFDFLNTLYLTAGESLPDSAHPSSNKRPRQGPYKFDEKAVDKTKLRHLPAGKFADYYRLCTLEYPLDKISKKLFSSVRDQASLSKTLVHLPL